MTDTTQAGAVAVGTMAGAAVAAEKVVEGVMKVEPIVASGLMFVPGAAPVIALVQPFVVMAAPFLERALTDISGSNGGDMLNAFIELMQHISKGQPNSPILSSPAASS
jgi:hypothetical protein